MPVAHKESNLLLDGSGDHSDMVKDETSSETGSCSLSSSSQTCDNILSFKCASSDAAAVRGINSRCAYTDAVLASVTCNESTTDRPRSENMSCVEDCSLEALNKGDISPLVDALGTLDICGSNKIEVEKHTLTISEEECELQKSDSSVHHNQVSKIPCSSKDLLYAIDKATEENVVCKEMKSDNACGLQLRSCNFSYTSMTVGSNMCNHDSHISENSNFPVNDCVNTSPDSCTMNISLPPLDMPFSFNCSENAATPSVFEHKNKIETEHVSLSCGIDTDQSKVNCMMLPSEILMPPAITEFPCGKLEVIKMNVGSEGKKTECCPSESVNVSQTYTDTTGITVISVSKGTAINTTSSIEATETCAMLSGTVSRKLSGTDSMSTSQPDIPQTSVGISSLASHPSPSPPAGSSHCITFISKTDSISDSFTSSLQPQRDSFVKTQNFGSIPSSVTNCNKLFETVADKTEGSVTFSPKGEQNTALGVISSMPASKNSFAEDIPLKLSASPALHNVSRDSSVFSGVHFCTLSSPISSSSVSKPGDTNFHLGTSSSDLEYSLGFGTSLKCGEPCTETFMDTVVSRTGTSLKPDITWSGVNVYSNTMNTSQQNNRLSNTKTKSLDTALISCGTLRFSPLTAQASSSLPNSSVVSIDQLGQVPRIENTALAMSLPNITDEDDNDPSSSWYTIQKSSLKNVAEYTRYSHSSSKPIFGSDFNFLKYESVKDTSVRNNIFGNIFQVNSPGNQSSTANASNMTAFSNGSSTLFRFGSVKMKRDKDFVWEPVTTVASNNFNTDIINKTFTFGIPSPATSSSVLFNSSGSKKTSEHKTELCVQGRSEFHLQRRSSNFAQTGSCFHRTLHKPSALFNVVKDTDTQIENGIVRLIVVQHQHITAMPEYSSLSFEELRLQFYNSKKQTESVAIMVNKEVQTTERFQEGGNNLTDMWKILECPVCLEIVTSPVFQCERGHHMCNHCWKRVVSCPLCKSLKSKTRNYFAEAMIEKLPLPCKYRVSGCSETVNQVDKAEHEKTCLFRAYTCLVDNCNQAHSFKDMMVHLKTSHSQLITRNFFDIPKRQKFTHTMSKCSFQSLVHAFDLPGWGCFFLCHKGSDQNKRLWVQVMKTYSGDTKFLYSIELANVLDLRSVSYQGPVVPFHTVTSEQQHDCLVLTDLLLDTLKKSFGFHITVSIWHNEF